ncbi:MAG: hypothetical protein RL685_143 [Pseudomonadota bacterium]
MNHPPFFSAQSWRVTAAVVVVLCAWLTPRQAAAYPQYVFKGYGSCGACHHGATGGGLANRWGRESLDASFGGDGLGPLNDDLTSEEPAGLKLDLGADVRMMPIFGTDGEGSLGPTVIPMLAELGGALSAGPWLAYGTITPRKLEGSGPSYVAFSREHWLGYRVNDQFQVRVGRLVLPFGLRQPDHTQYVREDFGFDKYDQSYSAEVDFSGEQWSISGNIFVGDLPNEPAQRQDRGLVLTGVREFESGAALGLSALGSVSEARTRGAGSLFARVPFGKGTYALVDLALQHLDAADGNGELSSVAEYLRLGWFVKPALDLYLEAGNRAFLAGDGLTKARLGLGASWWLFNWFELAPQLLAETRSDLPTRLVGMAQLHLIY